MKSYKENYIDDVETMNKILHECKYKNECEYFECYNYSEKFYIDFANIEFKLYVKLYGHTLPEKYIFRMDGSKASTQKASGKKAFQQLQKMSGNFIHDFAKDEYKGIFWSEWDNIKGKPIWDTGYERALLEFNPKYNNVRIPNCYGYDLNSSYAYAMLSDMPDTNQPYRLNSEIKENEIGFDEYDGRLIAIDLEGTKCKYVFPKVKSPFIKFVQKYYKLKKEATTKEERQNFKNMLNYAVGYIYRKNPFVHCCILNNARNYIERFRDKDTLYINTDSIVSRVKRPDIEALIGEELGQFKLEHFGDFARVNGAYQWNREIPSARGVSKQWFKEEFDILKDELPNNDFNKYYFDRDRLEILPNE